MLKKLLALFLSTCLGVILFSTWTDVQAQQGGSPDADPSAGSSIPTSVDLPFDAAIDGAAQLPSERPVSDEPISKDRVIIGKDDRLPVWNRAFPWSTMGRLDFTTARGEVVPLCTATLIGKDLLLTNSHCLQMPTINPNTNRYQLDDHGKPIFQFVDPQAYRSRPDKLVFKPGLIKGVALDEAQVIDYRAGWAEFSEDDAANDWALLKIDRPLGAADNYGHLGWRSLDFSDPALVNEVREKIKLAGYSGDFPTPGLQEFGQAGETAGVDLECSILDAARGLLIHDCDTNPGASGSAIFARFQDGRYYILGLHAGSNGLGRIATLPDGTRTERINRGVQVSQWADQARSMRQLQ